MAYEFGTWGPGELGKLAWENSITVRTQCLEVSDVQQCFMAYILQHKQRSRPAATQVIFSNLILDMVRPVPDWPWRGKAAMIKGCRVTERVWSMV